MRRARDLATSLFILHEMASLRNTNRLQVGSTKWISEERSSALQIVEQEAEEFSFSVRNELDWLNEHMAEVFDENLMWARSTSRSRR